jgi:acetyl/propionyl-CoA carboxylase alpha subunit
LVGLPFAENLRSKGPDAMKLIVADKISERGVKLMTLEAMKMQSNIYAPMARRIFKVSVTPCSTSKRRTCS